MLRLMNERESVRVVSDQRGSPTWTRDLAGTITALATGGALPPFGIYHYTNEGECSWFEFARKIYELGRGLGLIRNECEVLPCSSAEYQSKVSRPAYSVLDKEKIKAALGIEIPRWEESLEAYLKEEAEEECGV
jgi:dTDP-4-dehydrorhamnose reductase